MLRRSLLIAGIGILPAFTSRSRKARAAEAIAAPLPESERARVHGALAKNGYKPLGEWRRKGNLISTIAERDGNSWRLVLDGSTGEIIGQRLLATPAVMSQ